MTSLHYSLLLNLLYFNTNVVCTTYLSVTIYVSCYFMRILPYGSTADSCNETNKLVIFSSSDPALLDECGLDDNTKETLLGIIRRKLTQQAVKIRSDIEVACYGYEGIGAVKKALKAGIACSTEEIPIKINLIAPPLYVMTTQTPERQDGLKALELAIEKVQEVIVGLGGVFNIQMAVGFNITFRTIVNII